MLTSMLREWFQILKISVTLTKSHGFRCEKGITVAEVTGSNVVSVAERMKSQSLW